MVGDDKGRENLGDYGDFWGIFFDFFAFVDFFVGEAVRKPIGILNR